MMELNQYVKDVTSQMTTVTGGSNSIKVSSLTGTKTLNDKDLPVKESNPDGYGKR